VETSARRLWARPDADPFFFGSQWMGMPVLVRSERGANKGVKVSRLTGARATSGELELLGKALAELLARLHAVDPVARDAIAAQLERDDAFAAEQAVFAASRAAQVRADFELFRDALTQLGPTLGLPATPETAPAGDASELFRSSR
jgi:hypothetical protein